MTCTQPVTSPCAGLVTQCIGPREGFGLAGMALAVVAAAGWRALTRDPLPSGAAEPAAA